MSKKIPKCAYCGKALTPPRVLFDFSWCPGGPRVGWHQECVAKDDSYDSAVFSEDGGDSQDPPPKGEFAPVVVEVYLRGSDRVTCAGGRSAKRFEDAMTEAKCAFAEKTCAACETPECEAPCPHEST